MTTSSLRVHLADEPFDLRCISIQYGQPLEHADKDIDYKMFSVFVLTALISSVLASSRGGPVWPQPSSVEVGDEVVWLNSPFVLRVFCGSDGRKLFEATSQSTLAHYTDQVKQLAIDTSEWLQSSLFGPANASTPAAYGDDIIENDILDTAMRKFLWDMHTMSFVPWKFHKRHSHFEPEAGHQMYKLSSISINQAVCPVRPSSAHAFHTSDETYELVVNREAITVETKTTVGTLRAIGSYVQLLLTPRLN
jgi:hypothetical protein